MVDVKKIIIEYQCGKCNKGYLNEKDAISCCEKAIIDWERADIFELKQVHLDLLKNVYIGTVVNSALQAYIVKNLMEILT